MLAGAPRLALVLMWLFTDRLTVAFSSFWFGVVGFVLLPFTTTFYVLAYSVAEGGVTGFGWVFVVFGLLLDLGSYGGGRYSQQNSTATT